MKILLMYFTALYFYQKFYFCYLFLFFKKQSQLVTHFPVCFTVLFVSHQMQVWLMILLLLLQELMGRPLRLKFSQKNDDVSESNKEEEDVSEDQSAES